MAPAYFQGDVYMESVMTVLSIVPPIINTGLLLILLGIIWSVSRKP